MAIYFRNSLRNELRHWLRTVCDNRRKLRLIASNDYHNSAQDDAENSFVVIPILSKFWAEIGNHFRSITHVPWWWILTKWFQWNYKNQNECSLRINCLSNFNVVDSFLIENTDVSFLFCIWKLNFSARPEHFEYWISFWVKKN